MIVALEILCVVTAAIAISGLVVAVLQFGQIQAARERAAFDTCQILDSLILRSGQLTHHEARARSFLRSAGLGDCRAYSLKVRHGTI